MSRGLGTKDWGSEVLTSNNMDTYTGPPPNLVDVDMFCTPVNHTNWNTITTNASAIYNGYKGSSGSQNDLIDFDVVLAAGTWTLEILHVKSSTVGIYTIYLSTDGSSFTAVNASPYNGSASTIDGYSASPTYNNQSAITGITIAVTGRYCLRFKMETKNASASQYLGALQHVQLRRTA